MTNSDDGNDLPTTIQNTPDQTTPEQQHQTVMALLTALQQSTNDERATMQQFRDTVTRRLANPFESIGSLCFNLRTPSDEHATHKRAFTVAINPPPTFVPNHSAADITFDHYWGPFLNNMQPADVDRLLTYLTSRNNGANGNPSATTGAQGTSQVINQNRLEEPDNAELQALRQSDLEQRRRIKELEDALEASRADQTQSTTPHTENPTREADETQGLNESDEAQSSSNAQKRVQQGDAASGTSVTMSAAERADAELASREQDKEYGKVFADPNSSPTARDETSASGDRLNGRDRDEDDLSAHESDYEAVDGKNKRRKGKERAPNATSKRPSRDVPAKSRTPSATNSKSDGNATLADTEPAETSNATTQVDPPRRQSQRMLQLKADEAEKSQTKLEDPKAEKKRSRPYTDPKTGKLVRGYVFDVSDSEEEAASSSNSKSRKKTTINAQTSATKKRQSGTGAGADKTTFNSETKPPRGRKGGKTDIHGIQNQGTSKLVKRVSEVEETEIDDPIPEPEDDDEDEDEDENKDEDQDESDDDEGNGSKNDHRPARTGEKRKSSSSMPAAESNGKFTQFRKSR